MILTNLEQLVGGSTVGLFGTVSSRQWNQWIVLFFYSSLKDAGGALVVLDSSFHIVFFSFCCLPQGLESGRISINIKLLLVFTIDLEYAPGRPASKKIL